MTSYALLVLLVASGLSILAALAIVAGTNRLRRLRRLTARPSLAGARSASLPAPETGHERRASAAAEMIESVIQRRMADDASFAGERLDFGTSIDGSLEIWWRGQAYTTIEQLPDERLRGLIGQAIEEFNQGQGVPG